MFTAIIAETTDHKIAKYQEFQSELNANAHVQKYGGFVYIGIINDIKYTTVNMTTKTLVVDLVKKKADNLMNSWLYEMRQSDLEMSRIQEDLLDHLIDYHDDDFKLIDPTFIVKWNNKKAMRRRKP